MKSFHQKLKAYHNYLQSYPILFIADNFTSIHSIQILNIKTDRMMFSTFALFITLVMVIECSKLPENHDAVKELIDTIHRLEAKVAETEERAAETEAKRDREMKKTTDTMTRLAKEFSQMKVKIADIELQTKDLAKYKDQQGRVNSTSCNQYIHK